MSHAPSTRARTYGLTTGQEKVLDRVRDIARRDAQHIEPGPVPVEPQPLDDETVFGAPPNDGGRP